ncbi:MAG: phage integrase N-terminal SAM-like domain-containing protein [Blastocatellia bacterium]|nr:phage integrase N-terminal SAM-like domain-containing protein [Blastocatellia bacterium]
MNEAQKQQFQLLTAKFEEWMKAKNFSPRTIDTYNRGVKQFIEWIEENTECTNILEITYSIVQQYQISIYSEGVLSQKPRNVRTLFEFSQTTDFDKDIENLVTSIDV